MGVEPAGATTGAAKLPVVPHVLTGGVGPGRAGPAAATRQSGIRSLTGDVCLENGARETESERPTPKAARSDNDTVTDPSVVRQALRVLEAPAMAALLRELGHELYNREILEWRVLTDISAELIDRATFAGRARLAEQWLAASGSGGVVSAVNGREPPGEARSARESAQGLGGRTVSPRASAWRGRDRPASPEPGVSVAAVGRWPVAARPPTGDARRIVARAGASGASDGASSRAPVASAPAAQAGVAASAPAALPVGRRAVAGGAPRVLEAPLTRAGGIRTLTDPAPGGMSDKAHYVNFTPGGPGRRGAAGLHCSGHEGSSVTSRGARPAPALRALTARQRATLVLLALLAMGVFALGALAVTHAPVPEVDAAAKSFVQVERLPALERPMRALSAFGSGYVLFPLGLVGCALLALRHRRLALTLPLVALGAQLLTGLTKYVVGRPRPNLHAYGYPSGHALGTIVFFGLVIYVLWSLDAPRPWRRLAVVAAIVLAPAVAYSRLYLNAHWATDIVGGVAAGTAFVLAAVLVVDRLMAPAMAPAVEAMEDEFTRSSSELAGGSSGDARS